MDLCSGDTYDTSFYILLALEAEHDVDNTIKVILDWMRTKIILKTACFIFSNSKTHTNKLIAF